MSTAAGTYVASATAQLTSQGAMHLASITPVDPLDAARIHRFTLMWAYQAGDWNATQAAGGWLYRAFASANVFGAAVPLEQPQLAAFSVRVFPV